MTFSEIWSLGYFFEKYPNIHTIGSKPWVVAVLICAVIAYLLGSINCGVLISRMYGKDIRNVGSGNAGATNMTRTFGKKAGAFTFVGDFAKASVALAACRLMFGLEGAFVAGIFCIVGHAYPLYFKFKGGKGVVCIAAMGLFTTPLVLVIMLAIFAVILFGFKMVSFASIMTMIIYPYVLFQLEGYGPWILYASIAALFVVFLHRKNIVRIFNHTESKISLGKKSKASDTKAVNTEKQKISVEKCSGCGADVVIENGIGECTYCGKKVNKGGN
ncbi:MAG: glycerol-3-phosphate acyltransferase [Ruminococcaceae bacterium]|nr:glycerol-3-phosphate acyltransferase [Oscillospiraceae bacterium]